MTGFTVVGLEQRCNFNLTIGASVKNLLIDNDKSGPKCEYLKKKIILTECEVKIMSASCIVTIQRICM